MTDEGEAGAMAQARERVADERDRVADDREHLADERQRIANLRDDAVDRRANEVDKADQGADVRPVNDRPKLLAADRSAARRRLQAERAQRIAGTAGTRTAEDRQWAADRREFVADDRQEQADARELLADERESIANRRDEYLKTLVGSSGTDRAAEDAYAGAVADAYASREQAVAARAAAALARQVADGDRADIGGVNPLAAEFVNMTRSLIQSETVELAMQDVVHAAVRFVNGCDAASFSAYADDVVTTLASTGPIADEADAEQYRTFDGPCLQAIQTMQLVIAADLTSDQRWPKFVRAATNVRSVISAPVSNERPTGAEPGSLNNYSMQANAFTSEDANTAILLTAHLGVLLRLAVMTFEANTLVNQLTEAVTTRDVIGQAKGILMERERLTAGQAFDVLRAASQRLNRKLRDVADQLATSGEITTDPPGRDR